MTFLPLVIAHRGASGYRPEHTRAAYELAFEQGADAVEPDLVATKDGVLVVRHENDISLTTDIADHPEFADRHTKRKVDGKLLEGWFTEDFTWAELETLTAVERLKKTRTTNNSFPAQKILRLTDLIDMLRAAPLSAAGRPIRMVAEIKHATYFESIGLPLDRLFAEEMTAAGWAGDTNLIIESFEETVLTKIRARGIAGSLVFLVESAGKPADQVWTHGPRALPFREYLTRSGMERLSTTMDGISLDKRLLQTKQFDGTDAGADLVARAHAAGLSVFTWTLRPENKFLPKSRRHGESGSVLGDWLGDYVHLMGLGVDGVFADNPDLAIRARSALLSRRALLAD